MSPQPSRSLLYVAEADGVTVITIATDDLGEYTAEAIGAELLSIADELPCNVVHLDLSKVRFMTSTALGSIVALHKKLRAAGGELVITNVTEPVYELFDVSRLDQILDVRRQGTNGPPQP
jgi:anti-anti-sigma factor